ncbi:hypothetical protein DH2020_030816 [Rehmannia glutinosa]|uniref:UDP-glycosyltransferase n=1 Tax=Rehmannia glutinosa TaxID=99300 RepID=A0ABR0VN67_REHGL
MGTIRLRDLPTFIRTTNGDDLMFNYNLESVNNALKTGNLILNTFDDLEQEVLNILKTKFQNIYTIGPLSLLCQQNCEAKLESLESSLWKEDEKCLEWLDGKEPKSVLYVNYGSLVIMSPKQLSEFAWGLANSKCTFLWVIRPNLVDKGNEVISRDFLDEIKERANELSLYLYTMGIGMEIDVGVYRGEIEGLVRELMEGKKGMEIREKVLDWKKRAEKATKVGGSSYIGFDLLVEKLQRGT